MRDQFKKFRETDAEHIRENHLFITCTDRSSRAGCNHHNRDYVIASYDLEVEGKFSLYHVVQIICGDVKSKRTHGQKKQIC